MSPVAEKQKPITDEAKAAVESLLNATTGAATIHARMVAILAELPPLPEDDYNQQQKFAFRSHDSVLNALNPLLAKHGVFIAPEILDRITEQRSTKSGATMYEVNLLVRFTFYGLAGDSIVTSAWGEGTDMGDKATNKAMTMAFKNVLKIVTAVSTANSPDPDGETPEETTRGAGNAPVANRPAGRESAPSGPREGGLRYPEGFAQPKGWKELAARLAASGVPEGDQPYWLKEPVEAAGAEGFGRAKMVLALVEAEDLMIHQAPRAFMQNAIEKSFGGLVVAGPPWRIAPSETGLPTQAEWENGKKEFEAAEAAQEKKGDDIPF